METDEYNEYDDDDNDNDECDQNRNPPGQTRIICMSKEVVTTFHNICVGLPLQSSSVESSEFLQPSDCTLLGLPDVLEVGTVLVLPPTQIIRYLQLCEGMRLGQ